MSLVELRTYADPFEAEIVRGRLESEGFDVLVFDTGLSFAHGGVLPVRLMILDDQKAQALAALEREPDL